MRRQYYVLHDVDPSGGASPIDSHLQSFNDRGYGIFWTVNDFGNKPRKKENIHRINSWYVEIDDGDKGVQLALLLDASPAPPNLIVESKRGYHAYWNAREASPSAYQDIQSRLQVFFTGDPKAKDLSRILRAPGYNHMKDPSSPFPVRVIWDLPGSYTERLMRYNFEAPIDEEKKQEPRAKSIIAVQGDGFWEKVFSLDCEEALYRLSGSSFVNGDIYQMKPTGSGTLNIWSNGKPTSCWIDEHKRIGSSDGGGPTIYQWLRWFGHSKRDSAQIIKDVFPEASK